MRWIQKFIDALVVSWMRTAGRPLSQISVLPAKGAEGERLLKAATDAARKLGIFGAPTFAIGAEIFWGDDRLEEALAFAGRTLI